MCRPDPVKLAGIDRIGLYHHASKSMYSITFGNQEMLNAHIFAELVRRQSANTWAFSLSETEQEAWAGEISSFLGSLSRPITSDDDDTPAEWAQELDYCTAEERAENGQECWYPVSSLIDDFENVDRFPGAKGVYIRARMQANVDFVMDQFTTWRKACAPKK